MSTAKRLRFLTFVGWAIGAAGVFGADPSGTRTFWGPATPRVARNEPLVATRQLLKEELPNAAPSVPARTYTLAEMESLALQNNPTMAQANARIQAAQGKWIQDGLYPNPKLIYRGDEIGNEGKAGFQGAAVSQEIVTAKKRQLSQYADAHLVQQAEQEYAAQEFRVRNDVRILFYEVLLAQRAVELNEELRRSTESGAKAANDLFKAQETSRIDVIQSKVEVDMVEIQVVKAANSHSAAWRKLTAVVGLPNMTPTPLSGDIRDGLRPFVWEESLTQLLGGSPELSAARSRQQAAAWAVQRAYAERHPNFDVEVAGLHDNATSYDVASVNIGMAIPIFNRNQGNIQTAEANVRTAHAEIDRISLELRQRLANVFERYANSREQVERYEQKILPNAKESLALVTTSYKAGESNVLSLLLAQRTYIQAQTAHLDALRELRNASILLEGMLLTDSLNAR